MDGQLVTRGTSVWSGWAAGDQNRQPDSIGELSASIFMLSGSSGLGSRVLPADPDTGL